MSSYSVRPMTRDELDFAVDLAAREGWNPGLHDADCFHRADPGGFLVGLLDGRPIACISAVSYGGAFGFVGFYIVLPEYRGQGYGLRIWQAAMARLAGHNVGLDGVLDQQANYRKSGFKLAYRNIRYEGVASESHASAPLTPLGDLGLDALIDYDRAFFPSERRTFLEAWRALPESFGLAWLEEGRPRGYGVIRRCRRGWKIGPLFADDADIATALYDSLVARVDAGAPVYLDVPEVNPAALALAKRKGMRKVFETARMYTGEAPPLALSRLYGVTTFELG